MSSQVGDLAVDVVVREGGLEWSYPLLAFNTGLVVLKNGGKKLVNEPILRLSGFDGFKDRLDSSTESEALWAVEEDVGLLFAKVSSSSSSCLLCIRVSQFVDVVKDENDRTLCHLYVKPSLEAISEDKDSIGTILECFSHLSSHCCIEDDHTRALREACLDLLCNLLVEFGEEDEARSAIRSHFDSIYELLCSFLEVRSVVAFEFSHFLLAVCNLYSRFKKVYFLIIRVI